MMIGGLTFTIDFNETDNFRTRLAGFMRALVSVSVQPIPQPTICSPERRVFQRNKQKQGICVSSETY